MSKLPVAIAICLSAFAVPALAADAASTHKLNVEETTSKQSAAPAAAAKPAKTTSSARWHMSGNSAARVTSTAAGSVLGLPMSAVRVFAACDVEHAKAIPLFGDSAHKGFVWLSRAAVIPTATFVTVFGAPYYSTIHSWKASEEKPFSKECFGLGAYDDSICPP